MSTNVDKYIMNKWSQDQNEAPCLDNLKLGKTYNNDAMEQCKIDCIKDDKCVMCVNEVRVVDKTAYDNKTYIENKVNMYTRDNVIDKCDVLMTPFLEDRLAWQKTLMKSLNDNKDYVNDENIKIAFQRPQLNKEQYDNMFREQYKLLSEQLKNKIEKEKNIKAMAIENGKVESKNNITKMDLMANKLGCMMKSYPNRYNFTDADKNIVANYLKGDQSSIDENEIKRIWNSVNGENSVYFPIVTYNSYEKMAGRQYRLQSFMDLFSCPNVDDIEITYYNRITFEQFIKQIIDVIEPIEKITYDYVNSKTMNNVASASIAATKVNNAIAAQVLINGPKLVKTLSDQNDFNQLRQLINKLCVLKLKISTMLLCFCAFCFAGMLWHSCLRHG